MIAVVAAIIGMTVIGLPLVLAIDRDARGGALIGLAFLYGSGAAFAVMLVLPWRLPLIALALMAISAVAARVIPSRSEGSGRRLQSIPRPHPSRSAALGMTLLADLTTCLTLAGYAVFATISSQFEWDFIAIWGLKARVFFEHGGIDWHFLQSPWNEFAHPDYPLLVPLNFDFLALASGGWNDRWLGILFVAYAAALVLIVRELTSHELPAPLPALLTLGIAGLACTRFVGLAEGALVAFGTAAILFLRRGQLVHAALLFGFAASAKQEGVTLLLAAAISLVLARRWRDAIRLWPAIVIAAPWWIMALGHGLRSDLATTSMLQRAAARLHDPGFFAWLLITWAPDALLWLLILAAILVAGAAVRRREAPYLLILALQFAAMLFAYLTTPYNLRWHIVTSWPRLARQLLPAAAWLAMILLAKTFAREKNRAHAEAGPDH